MTKTRSFMLSSVVLVALALGCGSSKSSGSGTGSGNSGGGAGSGSGTTSGTGTGTSSGTDPFACQMMTAMSSTASSMCTGVADYTSCVQSKCEGNSCLSTDCKDYNDCVKSKGSCSSASSCMPSATCMSCLTTVGNCATSMCIDKLQCGTHAKGGACDQLTMCCASMMSNPLCSMVKLITVGGDMTCMQVLTSICPSSSH
jgi:hypothetical protein